MKTLMLAVLAVFVSSIAHAAAPPPAGAGAPPAHWDGERGSELKEEMQRKMHMMMVVGLADAMSLNESEALKLSDKLKGFEEKRRPVREAMGDAMKTLKAAAADGDASALTQVDAATQKVLDGRQQMAALDKEMFQGLSKDLTPQRRAQLALFLARFHAEQKFGKGMGGRGGRAGHQRVLGLTRGFPRRLASDRRPLCFAGGGNCCQIDRGDELSPPTLRCRTAPRERTSGAAARLWFCCLWAAECGPTLRRQTEAPLLRAMGARASACASRTSAASTSPAARI